MAQGRRHWAGPLPQGRASASRLVPSPKLELVAGSKANRPAPHCLMSRGPAAPRRYGPWHILRPRRGLPFHASSRGLILSHRLDAQFRFLNEADRLKSVLRAGRLCDGSRRENSAEHSWHLALYAMTLVDQAGPEVRIDRVIRMLILHDLVEIDTGDVPIHSANGAAHASAATQAAESQAASRIFGLLPADLAMEFHSLWEEFEAAETADAIFAKSLDRAQPVAQNLADNGGTWVDYQVSFAQLETRVGAKIARGAPQLWDWLRAKALRWFKL